MSPWQDLTHDPVGYLGVLISATDPRLIPAVALVVALSAWAWNVRKDQRERKQKGDEKRGKEEQQARDEAVRVETRKQAEAAKEAALARQRQDYLDAFKPCSTSCTVGEETVHVAWDGPLDKITDVRETRFMEPALLDALYIAICRFRAEDLQPRLEFTAEATGTLVRHVYETDEGRTWRRKLRSKLQPLSQSFLRVYKRKERCQSYCPDCGKTVSSGNYCSNCNREGQPKPLKAPPVD